MRASSRVVVSISMSPRHSLRAAGKVWDAGRLDAAAARLQPEPYQSPVSQNLITKFSQPQALAGWAGVLVVALAARTYDLRRRKNGASP